MYIYTIPTPHILTLCAWIKERREEKGKKSNINLIDENKIHQTIFLLIP